MKSQKVQNARVVSQPQIIFLSALLMFVGLLFLPASPAEAVFPPMKPYATNDSLEEPEGSAPVVIQVLDNDYNGAGDISTKGLSIISVSACSNGGTAIISGDGTTVTYALPGPDFTGTDSFKYTIQDLDIVGDGPSTATVTVTVNAVNDPPVNTVPAITQVAIAFGFGGPLVFSPSISTTDVEAAADNQPVQVNLTVAHGTLSLSGIAGLTFQEGTFNNSAYMKFQGLLGAVNAALAGMTYQATSGYFGPDMLTITTSDLGYAGGTALDPTAHVVLTDTDTVDILVVPPRKPYAINDSLVETWGSSPAVIQVLNNDINGAGYVSTTGLSITSVSVCTNGGTAAISDSGTTVTYSVPSPIFLGTDSFTYTIVDSTFIGDGPSTATVTVTVVQPLGSLTVTISPQGAIDAGAQWRRVGTTPWFNDGSTETSIPVGSYTVEFKTVAGWTVPSPVEVTISNGETTTASRIYIQKTIPVIQVTPISLNFGYVPAGSRKNLTLTVKNAGGGILTGNATTSDPFSIVSGGSYSLGADQSHVVTTRYQPTSSATHTGTVLFTGGGGATIPVTGKTEKPLGLPWLLLLLGN